MPTWQTVLLVAAFFIGVWGLFLLVIGILSRKHSWILPVFAIGLGAPRWCQMLWGTTFIGHSLPWADIGEGITRVKTGLLVGKALWLWLGVLDAIQGVGATLQASAHGQGTRTVPRRLAQGRAIETKGCQPLSALTLGRLPSTERSSSCQTEAIT